MPNATKYHGERRLVPKNVEFDRLFLEVNLEINSNTPM
jgi:hypothetical protein